VKLIVQSIKFRNPVPELLPQLSTATYLGPETKGWSAVADTETRELLLKARKTNTQTGKTTTTTYHLPFECLMFYTATGISNTDEPGEPKQ
jgi:hypothetical protein